MNEDDEDDKEDAARYELWSKKRGDSDVLKEQETSKDPVPPVTNRAIDAQAPSIGEVSANETICKQVLDQAVMMGESGAPKEANQDALASELGVKQETQQVAPTINPCLIEL